MRWLESEGSSYATGLVCVQGHGLCSDLDGNPEMVIKFCPKCGNSTLHQCPSCGAKIRGEHRGEGFIDIMRIGCYCHACGKAYPWTERKTQALKDMLNEVIEQEAERLKLEESIPDIITEIGRASCGARV